MAATLRPTTESFHYSTSFKKKRRNSNGNKRKKRRRVNNKAHPSVYTEYKEKHSSKAECTSAHFQKKKKRRSLLRLHATGSISKRRRKEGRCWRCCHTHHQNAPTQRRCVAATTHLKALVCAGAVACCKQNEAESYFMTFNKRATRVVTANSEGLFSSNGLQAFPFTWG